jgi:heat shock protein HslJ
LAIVSTWVDEAITAQFMDGQVAGFGGCNNYFGAYETDGESLTFGPIGSNMMACEEEVSQREMEFFAALEAVKAYSISRSTLTLTNAEGSTLITFQAQGAAP